MPPIRVQTPDGNVAEFPEGMNPDQIQSVLSKQFPAPPPPPTMMQKMGQGAKDLGMGMLKGAGSTANNIGSMLVPDRLVKAFGGTVPTEQQKEGYFKPSNTTQAVGKGIEQVGEFMVPGGAEEAGAEKIAQMAPKIGKLLPRMATSAVGSGLVNKAQGGGFGSGAAMGAGGSLVGEGLKAAAPIVAETALGIPKAARAFGKTPGKAILEETEGIRPESIHESAQAKMNQLTPEMEHAASNSPMMADLTPARDVITKAQGTAAARNAAGVHGQLEPMMQHLTTDFRSGAPIPAQVSPSELLNLKRGFGEEFGRWNPELHSSTIGAGRNAYRALDSELDRTVPEAAGLNQRISSLIPVARRAESVSRNAPTLQRAMGRFGAHTGALVGAGVGGSMGYKEGGVPGAIAGSLTGVLAPELLASPEGQMAMARTLNKAGSLKPLVGGVAQMTRKRDDQ